MSRVYVVVVNLLVKAVQSEWVFISVFTLVFLVLLVFLIYKLAKINLFFTLVKEGTAKAIMRGDSADRIIMASKGKKLDKEYNVVGEKEDLPLLVVFLGLWWIGLPPVKKVFKRLFRWTNVRENGELKYHDEEIDYIFIKDDIYWFKVEEAEDKNLLPLDIEITFTVRIVNVYKALFVVHDWLESSVNLLKPRVRDLLTQDTYENWIEKKESVGDRIFNEAKNILEFLNNEYGVEVVKIQVKKINPPAEYREKTLAPYFAQLEKEAEMIKTETAALKQVGSFVQSIAISRGITLAEAQNIIKNDKDLQERMMGIYHDIRQRQLTDVIDFRTGSTAGEESKGGDDLINLIALGTSLLKGKEAVSISREKDIKKETSEE